MIKLILKIYLRQLRKERKQILLSNVMSCNLLTGETHSYAETFLPDMDKRIAAVELLLKN